MSLFKILENPIIKRFHRAHDEDTTQLAQFREQGGILYDVLHFRRQVESQLGKIFVELPRHSKRVRNRVQRVGVSEGDVLSPHADLSRYVFANEVALNNAQTTFINRCNRTMQAGVNAAA